MAHLDDVVPPATVLDCLKQASSLVLKAAQHLDHATAFPIETENDEAAQIFFFSLREQAIALANKIYTPEDGWPKGKAEIIDLETKRRQRGRG